MRIALVTETYPPEVNGVAMTLGRTVDGLRRRGHAVELIRPRQDPDDEVTTEGDTFNEVLVSGIPLPRYQGLHLGLPAKGFLLRRWSAHRPDIVHVATEGPLGASALAAARRLDLPVSTGFHTNFDAYCRHYGVGWLRGAMARYLRHFHNLTDATLVPTQAMAEALGRDGYRNLAVVSRGVDTRLFSPSRRCPLLRAEWGAKPDDLVVSYVGRLAPEKNLALLLEAFAAIQRLRPEARLLLVGDGPSRQQLARQRPDIIFAGMRHGTDLAAHYASADLFLFPSLTETFGNVTAEALASGLGVVAFDCASATDLIQHGKNGLLASPGNRDDFIDAATAMAATTDLRQRVRHQAAPSIRHLDWERIHDTFADTLRQVAAGHERRRLARDRFIAALD